MPSGNIALVIWEDLMESRLYGPGRHQSFPVVNSVCVVVCAASLKLRETSVRESAVKQCNSQQGLQDAFQRLGGAFHTIVVI